MTKKLINQASNVVSESLEGFVLSNPGLNLLRYRSQDGQIVDYNVVYRNDWEDKKDHQVALISGGGSGHEPSHHGFIGKGMLTATVSGKVFASPAPTQVLSAIKKVGGKAGVLLIVKNYTGDRVNFGLAAQRAREDGIQVELVIVGDDCALPKSKHTAGRRGLCGTLFVHKIAGWAADLGMNLTQVSEVARHAAQSIGTVGVALGPCSLPGSAPSFQVDENMVELGLGIHGEPGFEKIPLETVDILVSKMVDMIVDQRDSDRGYLDIKKNDSIALIVNGLGGTSALELGIATRSLIFYLRSLDLIVKRVYVGNLMTSLEMPGLSVTLLKVNGLVQNCLTALDHPTNSVAWPRPLCLESKDIPDNIKEDQERSLEVKQLKDLLSHTHQEFSGNPQASFLKSLVKVCCETLINSEPILTELDTLTGDGDYGQTMQAGATEILKHLDQIPFDEPSKFFSTLSHITQTHMGGSSGAFYSIMFSSVSGSLKSIKTPSPEQWFHAFKTATDSISEIGGAKQGDRTMLDALYPALLAFEKGLAEKLEVVSLCESVESAASNGAKLTQNMQARAGRSSYVREEQLTNIADPGAIGASLWIQAAGRFIKSSYK